MQHFYDGQIRRYLTQTIRALSNFVVRYGDGTLVRVPVMYGDADRQASSIIRQNSENVINSSPRISVYISGLDLDRDRLSDSTYVGKLHIRERDIDLQTEQYTQGQGKNYTVERLMPTPFKLTMKADIWSSNTEQKLQILEQILVLFNPSLEIQTTDNYVDWTSLTVLNLSTTNWSSRTVPVGSDTPIDIATLTLDTPIWISPPVKVKHLGVITNIITSIYQGTGNEGAGYIDGLTPYTPDPTLTISNLLSEQRTTITDYNIHVYGSQAMLYSKTSNALPVEPTLDIPVLQGPAILWSELFDQYPGKFIPGSSTLFLTQPNGTEVVGTIAVNPLNETLLEVSWDPDTYPINNGIDSNGLIETVDADYDGANSYRPGSPGTFNAIIDPSTKAPRGSGLPNPTIGIRYLIVEDIGADNNTDGADAWKGDDDSDLIAHANDIIEWNGTKWQVIFDSIHKPDVLIYQTNIYTTIQYMWNGVTWVKSFEGSYRAGHWRIEL